MDESLENTKTKRERSVNFTREETDLLLTLAVTKRHIIENKKSDAATWQEKETAWRHIEDMFNSSSVIQSVYRNHKHLKLKYEALKRDIRKKCSALRHTTGGVPNTVPELTPLERKLRDILFHSNDNNESYVDSDVVQSSPLSSESISWPGDEDVKPDTEQVFVNEMKEEEPPRKKVCEQPGKDEPKEKSQADKLREQKLEVAILQRKILTEELEQKQLQRQFLEKEQLHKESMYALENQHLRLKIRLLKKQLRNPKIQDQNP